MMLLVNVFHDFYHAVERDLLSMGLHVSDLGTSKLSVWELISIVEAAQPGTAIYNARRKGWSHTDHLIANLGEQWAGLLTLKSRHPRPGVEFKRVTEPAVNGERPYGGVPLQAMSIHELTSRRQMALAKAGAN